MIVWTPNRPPFNETTRGQVAITTIPEGPATRPHPVSVGACSSDWNEADDAGRKELMQGYVTEMLYRDNIPLTAIRKAVSEIDEYTDFPFSTDKPEDDADE